MKRPGIQAGLGCALGLLLGIAMPLPPAAHAQEPSSPPRLRFQEPFPVSPPAAARAEEPAPSSFVNFSFDEAEIRLMVKLVGELTGRRFVVDEKIVGRVTVVSPGKVAVDEVYPLFLSILENRGYSVIEKDGAFFIVPLQDRAPAPPVVTEGAGSGGLVTRLFALSHIGAAEVAKALEPLVRGGKTGGVTVFGPTNHLIVTDTADGVRRVEQVLAELDKPGSARAMEVCTLQFASAEDLAQQLSFAMKGAESAGRRVSRHIQQVVEGGAAQAADYLVVASPQSNSLVLVGTPVQLSELKRMIQMLDIEPTSGHGRLNVLFLKYLSAEDAAKSLSALLAKTVAKDAQAQIAIEPSAANNALLVEASPRDFQWLKELVDSLDQAPQQVMVEVLIAEVSLDNKLDLGVQWSTVESPKDGKTTFVGRSRPGETDAVMEAVTSNIFPQGLAVGLARGVDADGRPKVPFMLSALKQNNNVNILSSVPLWAQNNTEASVNVVDNIPVLRSTIEGGSGTARDVIQNIDRIDVGIKLKITPHVNPDNEITLDLNPSIEAVVDQGPPGMNFAPTIAKREVKTTVTVPNRSVVVISGMIREDRFKKVSKVPLLGDIPLLGHLFRYTSDQKKRTNLMIFVSPTLVTDPAEAERMRLSMQQKAEQPLALPATDVKPPAPDGE